MVIAVDFDNTIVKQEYPLIGEPVVGAFETMKKWQQQGHKLILYTMRGGYLLEAAVKFCQKHGVEFWGINENPDQILWKDPASCKVYADLVIDDHNVGCPLTQYGVVDWKKVEELVDAKQINLI